MVWNSLNVTHLLLSASGATEPWHWNIANPPLPSMLGFPSGTPSPSVRCDGNCSSQAQIGHVTLNRLWKWWGQGPHLHPGPWRLLLVARTKLGAAVCFTIQLAPTPPVLQGTAPHLFSTFLPRCREQKSTHSPRSLPWWGGEKTPEGRALLGKERKKKLKGVRRFESGRSSTTCFDNGIVPYLHCSVWQPPELVDIEYLKCGWCDWVTKVPI